MFAYIDAGTAAAIAAMATGGLAGAKVAVQSVFYGRRGKKNAEANNTNVDEVTEEFDVDEVETLEQDVVEPATTI